MITVICLIDKVYGIYKPNTGCSSFEAVKQTVAKDTLSIFATGNSQVKQ
jgi:hypothetical protein